MFILENLMIEYLGETLRFYYYCLKLRLKYCYVLSSILVLFIRSVSQMQTRAIFFLAFSVLNILI